MGRLTSLGGLCVQGLAVGMAVMVFAGCDERTSATELNPEGPPMLRQLIVTERVNTTNDMGNPIVRIVQQFAFGTHPDFAEAGDLDGNGTVTNAIARGNQSLRVVIDELLVGNNLEEIACADGTWSRVLPGTTPDNIADCAGPELSRCTGDFTVCVGSDGPVGILDENEDGAVDDTRMLDGIISLTCDGVDMPLDLQQSFYQPSGNQQIPAGGVGLNGLGPALVLVPTDGMRTGAQCALFIDDTVVDKDNQALCAPPGGDITLDCTPGDLTGLGFGVEPMRLTGADPPNNSTNISLGYEGPGQTAVLVATAGVLPLYAQAGAGVGAMLTAPGILPMIDGVAVSVSDRVLVKNGAAGKDNGIYTVTAVGAGVASATAPQAAVDLATDGALPAYTQAGAGAGATLTADAVGVLTVDGVATVLGDRILVKDGAAGSDDGIYTVTTEGAAAAAFVLTRAVDHDTDAEVTSDDWVNISGGTANGGLNFQISTVDPIVVDTTAVTWAEAVSFILTRATDHDEDAEVTSRDWVDVTSGTVNAGAKFQVTTTTAITVDTTAVTWAISDPQILIQFNANIAESCVANIEVRADGTLVPGLTPTVGANDATIVTIVVAGGYEPDAEYEITLLGGDGGLCDLFGGVLPADTIITFHTRDIVP